jgi:hypothetical protein
MANSALFPCVLAQAWAHAVFSKESEENDISQTCKKTDKTAQID